MHINNTNRNNKSKMIIFGRKKMMDFYTLVGVDELNSTDEDC